MDLGNYGLEGLETLCVCLLSVSAFYMYIYTCGLTLAMYCAATSRAMNR